jgi:hypothetical protein
MLLFVCNGTGQGSIKSNNRQMLEIALNNIELNGMMPEEFNNRDTPYFTLKLNAPRVPSFVFIVILVVAKVVTRLLAIIIVVVVFVVITYVVVFVLFFCCLLKSYLKC